MKAIEALKEEMNKSPKAAEEKTSKNRRTLINS